MPGFWISFFSALLPVILISVATIAGFLLAEDNEIRKVLGCIGNPVFAMLLSVLFAIYTLGLARGRKMTDIMNSLAHSVTSITMIMLLIAGAGALKQVLVDGGVSTYIGGLLSQINSFASVPGVADRNSFTFLCWFRNSGRYYNSRYSSSPGYRRSRKT